MTVDGTARLENPTVGDADLREYVTVHDAVVGVTAPENVPAGTVLRVEVTRPRLWPRKTPV